MVGFDYTGLHYQPNPIFLNKKAKGNIKIQNSSILYPTWNCKGLSRNGKNEYIERELSHYPYISFILGI